MKRETAIILAIVIPCIIVFTLITWNKQKQVIPEISVEMPPHPCDLPLLSDTVFNGYWIGMSKAHYNHKLKFMDFKTENESGKIVWIPEWDGDTLRKLRIGFNAELPPMLSSPALQEASDQLLAIGAWKELFISRLKTCDSEQIPHLPGSWLMMCGRVALAFYSDQSTIIMYDKCYEMQKTEAKEREDSIKIEASKSLFN